MLYGAVRHCPVFGSKIDSIDDSAAKTIPGVIAVIPLENLAIVVAANTWIAMQGADALVLQTTGGDSSFSDADIDTRIQQSLNGPDEGAPVAHEGDAEQAISSSGSTVELEYAVSLQAHATMEPPCATAHVTEEGCDVWAPTQTQDFTAMVAMMITQLPPEKIRIHTTYLGGGFGRKTSPDYTVQALIASKVTGRPVKVTWSRTEDIQHDQYLPPFRVRLNAGLDTHGVPRALSVKFAGPSPSRPMVTMIGGYFPPWLAENGFDWATCVGMFDFTSQAGSYAIPDLKVNYVPTEIPVPVGFWRSIGTVHNAFALESAMDEIAHASGVDPIDLRRSLLREKPRALRVLDRVEQASGWGGTLPEGHYQGMGYIYYLDCYQAQVAEVSVDKRGRTRVHRITCVIDCGQAINPAIVESQIQGAIIYGLSGSLTSRINIENGRVVQGNFDDYPLPKLKVAPVIDVHIINSGEQPGGIGEAGTPLVGPTVANAVFAATGKRIRRLPISRSDLV
jgi:isoquinoline 1-oxidoreductase beta subunit